MSPTKKFNKIVSYSFLLACAIFVAFLSFMAMRADSISDELENRIIDEEKVWNELK